MFIQLILNNNLLKDEFDFLDYHSILLYLIVLVLVEGNLQSFHSIGCCLLTKLLVHLGLVNLVFRWSETSALERPRGMVL